MSKGSAPRPFGIPPEEYEANHARVFGARPPRERYTPPPSIEEVREAVLKMREGYEYGAGYYNQDIFIEGLKGLFVMFGLPVEDEEYF